MAHKNIHKSKTLSFDSIKRRSAGCFVRANINFNKNFLMLRKTQKSKMEHRGEIKMDRKRNIPEVNYDES